MVTGKVVQFRRGRHVVHERHMLIAVDGVSSREDASKLVGKDVEWTSPAGKKIKGKVSSAHGNNGVVRAIFEKGLPGQSVATEVKVE
jgi:large subunit ribosomal protein L35Ae